MNEIAPTLAPSTARPSEALDAAAARAFQDPNPAVFDDRFQCKDWDPDARWLGCLTITTKHNDQPVVRLWGALTVQDKVVLLPHEYAA